MVTKNTGTQGLYSVSSSSSGSRCGHKQAAQGPVSLNGREQKQEASSLRRVRAGKCKAWQQLSAERGSVSMDRERASGRHGMEAGGPGRSVLGGAEVRMNGRGLGALALLGRVPESLAGAWPGRQDTRPG